MTNRIKLSHAEEGSLVVGMSRDGKELYATTEDTHTLILGATRSGKSRGIVLPSICFMALAGESMICVDPKAELYLYTYPFLERLGYEVIAIDFRNPLKSSRYNYLQTVIDAVNQGDKALAVTRARDMATMLVPEDKTERIWLDGQRSVVTMAILAVVVDNMGHLIWGYHIIVALFWKAFAWLIKRFPLCFILLRAHPEQRFSLAIGVTLEEHLLIFPQKKKTDNTKKFFRRFLLFYYKGKNGKLVLANTYIF